MVMLLANTSPTVQYFDGSAWQTLTHVRSYSYTSGRRDENTGASPGTATFVLDNSDSTFLGIGVNLLPKMTPIRVMVNSGSQARWSGWVDGSPVAFPSPEGTSSFLTVTAHDSLALMQRHICQTSIYEETLATAVQTATPAGSFVPAGCGYWPLSDGIGASGGYEATGAGLWGSLSAPGASFAQAGVNGSQSSAVMGLNGSASLLGSGSVSSGVTLGVWFKNPTGIAGGVPGTPIMQLNFGSGCYFSITTDGSKFVGNTFDGAGHGGTASFNTVKASDGDWHYIQAIMDGAGGVTLYVDGSSVASDAAAAWAPASSAIGLIAISSWTSGALVCHAWTALAQNAAAGSSLFASATLNLSGLTTTQLISGYLAKWALPLAPFGANAIDTQNNGSLTPSGIAIAGNDCLSLAQVAVDTEDGLLYCLRSGVIASLTHASLTDRATGSATSFVNGDVEADLTFTRDAQFLVTNCQITALSGSGGVQSATNNLAKLGTYLLQKSLYLTDYQALDYATWRTQVYGDINYSRIGQFTIDLLSAIDIQTTALMIDVGSRVTFSGLPTQGGYTTADVIVQGFTETWTIDGWAISFNTTPSANYLSWILEDPVYGLLDSTTVLGY